MTPSPKQDPAIEAVKAILDYHFYEYEGDRDNINEATAKISQLINEAKISELKNLLEVEAYMADGHLGHIRPSWIKGRIKELERSE
jgi:hypothetical protein